MRSKWILSHIKHSVPISVSLAYFHRQHGHIAIRIFHKQLHTCGIID